MASPFNLNKIGNTITSNTTIFHYNYNSPKNQWGSEGGVRSIFVYDQRKVNQGHFGFRPSFTPFWDAPFEGHIWEIQTSSRGRGTGGGDVGVDRAEECAKRETVVQQPIN